MCQYVFCYNHQKIYMFLCLIIRLKEFLLKFFHFFLDNIDKCRTFAVY